MKLYQKIMSDVKASEKKGYIYSKSFGSVKAFTELKGISGKPFQEILEALNEYLKPHKIVAFYSSKAKGVLFTRASNFKQDYKRKKQPSDGLEL